MVIWKVLFAAGADQEEIELADVADLVDWELWAHASEHITRQLIQINITLISRRVLFIITSDENYDKN